MYNAKLARMQISSLRHSLETNRLWSNIFYIHFVLETSEMVNMRYFLHDESNDKSQQDYFLYLIKLMSYYGELYKNKTEMKNYKIMSPFNSDINFIYLKKFAINSLKPRQIFSNSSSKSVKKYCKIMDIFIFIIFYLNPKSNIMCINR